jgi:hypothetical protein
MRATMSEPPPGAYGTIMRMGFVGYAAAVAARCDFGCCRQRAVTTNDNGYDFRGHGAASCRYSRPYPNLLSARAT